jgi:hypothetical protein
MALKVVHYETERDECVKNHELVLGKHALASDYLTMLIIFAFSAKLGAVIFLDVALQGKIDGHSNVACFLSALALQAASTPLIAPLYTFSYGVC